MKNGQASFCFGAVLSEDSSSPSAWSVLFRLILVSVEEGTSGADCRFGLAAEPLVVHRHGYTWGTQFVSDSFVGVEGKRRNVCGESVTEVLLADSRCDGVGVPNHVKGITRLAVAGIVLDFLTNLGECFNESMRSQSPTHAVVLDECQHVVEGELHEICREVRGGREDRGPLFNIG